ncbi:response regulator [Gammaproteobacteria bacterium]|nr:response regulator [Gammaproteobacteria bacterium]
MMSITSSSTAGQVRFHKSMRGRFLLFGVLPTIVLLGAIVIYNAINMYSRARADNEQHLQLLTVELAEEIERTNNRAVIAAQVMALAQQSGLFGNRPESSEYARQVLEFYPEFTGAYFGYEPNADGDDMSFRNSAIGAQMLSAMDKTGRFIPYWYRDKSDNTKIVLEPLVDMDTSLYYAGIKESFEKSGNRYIVTEPYIYEGKMIVEQTAPVVINGKFAGIAGVDRALTDLVSILDNIKRQHRVDVFLISHSGRFIADTLGKQVDLRTQAYEKTPYRDLFTRLYSNRKAHELVLTADPLAGNSRYYYVSASVPTGDWTVVIRKAENDVIAPIRANVLSSIGVAGAGLFTMLLLMLWLTNSLTRRLRSAVQAADMMATGTVPKDIVLETGTEDEIGLMNHSFNRVMKAFRDITRVSVAVAAGDFSQQVTPRSDQDDLARAINRMTERRQSAEEELRSITRTTELQHNIANALNGLNDAMRGEQAIQPLCDKTINYIARYLALPFASMFVRREANNLDWQAGYATPEGYRPASQVVGQGLAGQAARDLRPLETAEISDNFELPTGLGDIRPARLLYFPIVRNGRCLGVLELGLLNPLEPSQVEWLEQAANSIAVSIQLALDIDRREKVELELAEAKNVAEAANQAKSGFLANMSHELRTPMNAILGYSEMLIEEAEDVGQDDFIPDLKKINQAGNHLLSLINDVLDLSKVESGKMEAYAENFDVGALIDQVSGTAQPLMTKNTNHFKIERSEHLGNAFQDVTKIRQSLLNMLSNAAKFTHEGVITLRAGRENIDGVDWLTFAVDDTGIGIPADKLDHVFEEFSQADSSTTRDYGGTGLGLTISRRFCQMLGGDMTVTSKPGTGSTFTIRLPAEFPGAEAPRETSTQPDASIAQQLDDVHLAKPGSTILVIDDDAEACEIIRRFLEKDGFHVVTAASGEQGLRLAHELQPAAITLDVMMPDMDGWSVLRALKVDPVLHMIPVIMLSMIDDRTRGYSLGAVDYLTKPVNRELLHKALSRYYCAEDICPVLLVEDDIETREMMARTLDKAGWAVSEAGNGKEALDIMAGLQPRLILLDLMMPVMDGFDFLTAMRAQPEWQHIPVVVLTAKDLTADDRDRLAGKVEEVLEKNAYTREQLLERVSEAVTACGISETEANTTG